MTPEKQRITIAKACGWKLVQDGMHPSTKDKRWKTIAPNGVVCQSGYEKKMSFHIPDYLNDLNAMHEAVQRFRYPQSQTLWSVNQHHLGDIVSRDNNHSKESVSFQWEVQNASAPQRAEAFLRTLRLWKD